MRFPFLIHPVAEAGLCRARLWHFLLPLAVCWLFLPVFVHAQAAPATGAAAEAAPTPPPRFAVPPPEPTPFIMEKPATDKRVNEETQAKYKDHPEQAAKDFEQDRQMQHNAALHDQAVRDREAYVEDQRTKAERGVLVADQLSRNPFLETKPGTPPPESVGGQTKVPVWIVTGVLVVSLLGILWWTLAHRGKPAEEEAPEPRAKTPQGRPGNTSRKW